MNSDDRHYRVLVWGLPSPLLGSLLLLLSQSMNTLLLPQLLPGVRQTSNLYISNYPSTHTETHTLPHPYSPFLVPFSS